jgi:hypothetical protein
MNSTLWILLYSKFSPACKSLLDFIKQTPLDVSFKLLEIDNKEIRSRVLNDQRFSIKNVPTIVSISSSGIANQYEGEKAYELVMAMAMQNQSQSMPMQSQSMPMQSQSMPMQSQSMPMQSQSMPMQVQSMPMQSQSMPMQSQSMPMQSQSMPMQSQSMPMQSQSMPMQNQSMPMQSQSTPVQEGQTITMIEDLIDEPVENNNVPSKFDASVNAAIKGEKISASSVMSNMQKTDVNPRINKQQQPTFSEREDAPKQTGSKVNISSVMAASRP